MEQPNFILYKELEKVVENGVEYTKVEKYPYVSAYEAYRNYKGNKDFKIQHRTHNGWVEISEDRLEMYASKVCKRLKIRL